jgi:hypothetical protein
MDTDEAETTSEWTTASRLPTHCEVPKNKVKSKSAAKGKKQ